MAKKGEWIIVHSDDIFTLVPVFQCSVCKKLTSGYITSDDICPHCEAQNKVAPNKCVELSIADRGDW